MSFLGEWCEKSTRAWLGYWHSSSSSSSSSSTVVTCQQRMRTRRTNVDLQIGQRGQYHSHWRWWVATFLRVPVTPSSHCSWLHCKHRTTAVVVVTKDVLITVMESRRFCRGILHCHSDEQTTDVDTWMLEQRAKMTWWSISHLRNLCRNLLRMHANVFHVMYYGKHHGFRHIIASVLS